MCVYIYAYSNITLINVYSLITSLGVLQCIMRSKVTHMEKGFWGDVYRAQTTRPALCVVSAHSFYLIGPKGHQYCFSQLRSNMERPMVARKRESDFVAAWIFFPDTLARCPSLVAWWVMAFFLFTGKSRDEFLLPWCIDCFVFILSTLEVKGSTLINVCIFLSWKLAILPQHLLPPWCLCV